MLQNGKSRKSISFKEGCKPATEDLLYGNCGALFLAAVLMGTIPTGIEVAADVEVIQTETVAHIEDRWDFAGMASACANDGSYCMLRGTSFYEVQADGAVNEHFFGGSSGEVAYDSESTAHVFIEQHSGTWMHYWQNAADDWDSETMPNEADHIVMGPDDYLHAAGNQGDSIVYFTNRSGNWQSNVVATDTEAYLYIKDLCVDQNGDAHILYPGGYAAERYANNKSGRWQAETIYTDPDWPSDGSCTTTPYYRDSCLSVYPDGTPLVVARYTERVPACSVIYSQLHCLHRAGRDSWSSDLIADSSDGFYGSDGDKYTGYDPHAVIDSKNNVHVIFSDAYVKHDPHQEYQRGQIRYALNRGGGWNFSNIFPQTPNPDHNERTQYTTGEWDDTLCDIMEIINLAVSPNGRHVHAFGLRMPSTEAGYDADLIHMEVRVPVPIDVSPVTRAPTGTLHGIVSPEFSWTPLQEASWYRIWIGLNGKKYLTKWTQDSAWHAEHAFPAGSYLWFVQGWNGCDFGPWSKGLEFMIPKRLPDKVELLYPAGSIATNNPSFAWTEDEHAVWYQLYVQKDSSGFFTEWMEGETNCIPDRTFPMGKYKWWVQAWSPDGSTWSNPESFTYGLTEPLTPAGTIADVQPEFSWTEVGDADWYQLWVTRNGGFYGKKWVQGEEFSTFADPLLYGDYKWWVRCWSRDSGMGPWSVAAEFSLGKAEPVSPSGNLETAPTQLRWNDASSADATWYQVWIGRDGAEHWAGWFERADTAAEGDERTFSVPATFDSGAYQWWIRAWSPDHRMGPWVEGTEFTVP